MARGRLVSKSLGSSRKFHALLQAGGKLGEFCQSLFVLVVVNTDDFGRLPGDAFTIKNVVLPSSPRPERDFERALQLMADVGLIRRYEVDKVSILQVELFDQHQANLHKRTGSLYPPPEGATAPLSMSEATVEERIAADLASGRLTVSGFTVTTVTRQVRRSASYLDIVAETTDNITLVVEVKRQRVTGFAISQVLEYCQLIAGPSLPIVIGYGVADNLTLPISDVLIGTYGDDLHITTINTCDVKSQLRTLNHIPPEFNVTESKRTQPKGTEENSELRVERRASADLFECFWDIYPRKKAKEDARKAWHKRRPNEALLDVMIHAIQVQALSDDWQKQNGKYIPYPATWLNSARWTDVVEIDAAAGLSETARHNLRASEEAGKLIEANDAERTGTHGYRR